MNWQALEDALVEHGLPAFRRIREARPDDTFYSFALFTSGEFAYVATTAASYEGLAEAASSYQAMESYKDQSLEDLRRELKWSPEDSPLHESCGELLEAVQPMMDEVVSEFDACSDDEFDAFVDTVLGVFERALRRIDAEGVFGTGEERKKVVVNLLMGDESDEERLAFARRLNPPEAIQELKKDLTA